MYTTVEIDTVGVGPEGGHCDLQFETEHLFPGQDSKQYSKILEHHPLNSEHFAELGQPALLKHEAI